jgi:hypothetical protein
MNTRKEKCKKGKHVLILNLGKLECVFCGKKVKEKNGRRK